MISKTIPKKCKKIKLIITDVDGVLTDGGIYYSEKGEEQRKFNTRDGVCVFLRNHGIKTVFLTSENSKFAKVRGKKVKAMQYTLTFHQKKKNF
jgi:N-acylneuraminate cytidylyltransferase